MYSEQDGGTVSTTDSPSGQGQDTLQMAAHRSIEGQVLAFLAYRYSARHSPFPLLEKRPS
jgi:hypothetical protein